MFSAFLDYYNGVRIYCTTVFFLASVVKLSRTSFLTCSWCDTMDMMDRAQKSNEKYALAFQLVTQLTNLVVESTFANRIAVLRKIREAWEKNKEVTIVTGDNSFEQDVRSWQQTMGVPHYRDQASLGIKSEHSPALSHEKELSGRRPDTVTLERANNRGQGGVDTLQGSSCHQFPGEGSGFGNNQENVEGWPYATRDNKTDAGNIGTAQSEGKTKLIKCKTCKWYFEFKQLSGEQPILCPHCQQRVSSKEQWDITNSKSKNQSQSIKLQSKTPHPPANTSGSEKADPGVVKSKETCTYKCTKCKKHFSSTSSLKRHMKIVCNNPANICKTGKKIPSRLTEPSTSQGQMKKLPKRPAKKVAKVTEKKFGAVNSLGINFVVTSQNHSLPADFSNASPTLDEARADHASQSSASAGHFSNTPNVPIQGQLYKCRYCDKQSKRRYAIVEHERKHTSMRPFPCKCGKAFATAKSLKGHQLICK